MPIIKIFYYIWFTEPRTVFLLPDLEDKKTVLANLELKILYLALANHQINM